MTRLSGQRKSTRRSSRYAPETAQAWPPTSLLEHTAQLVPAQLAALFSRNQIVLQLAVVEPRRHIEQRPLERGDRDSVLYTDVLAQTSDLDRTARAPDVPEVRGAAVGKDGGRAASQNRRHPFALQSDTAMTERENAAVQWQEPSSLDTAFDQPSVKSKFDQLTQGDDTVLGLRQFANRGGRRIPRCNALPDCWPGKTLHRRERKGDLGHALTLAGINARVAR